ncbi:MAG TPA: glycine cleavage system protein GcvH [Kiloniellaceae bacterium]|nr:glycine cleavage system protein GcvH [Kiloniellaceae bacterium]
MSHLPADLRYTESHEWVRDEGNGTVTIGITDHAQEMLGDLVFVELPEAGDTVDAGGECGVVESVKAASDIFCPVSGEIVEVNGELADAPETVNQDAFGDGWLFKVKLSDPAEMAKLLDADGYEAVLAEED